MLKEKEEEKEEKKQSSVCRPTPVYYHMNIADTYRLFRHFEIKLPNFFQTLSDSEKEEIMHEYSDAFRQTQTDIIYESIRVWFRNNKMFPYAKDLKPIVQEVVATYYHKKYPGHGKIYYNDADMKRIDWDSIPEDIEARMTYRPDPNDEERNELLKQAQRMQINRIQKTWIRDMKTTLPAMYEMERK